MPKGIYKRSKEEIQRVIVRNCARTVHGHAKGTSTKESREYCSWKGMIQRCTNPRATGYERYGGVGVTVCERWRVFQNFLKDMGPRPLGKTLDRYPDNKGDYTPDNCRWASPREQVVNRDNSFVARRKRTLNGRFA